MNKRKVGDFYEGAVANLLKEQNMEILERNYSCRIGEIDIIAANDDTVVFIEVKYRKNADFGRATEAVPVAKQRKIIRTAQFYLKGHSFDKNIRFDVIGITGDEIEWIENAFGI